MRDPARIEKVLNKIREIWYTNPDLRLCQLLLNLVSDANVLYWVEDDKLIKALEEIYQKR